MRVELNPHAETQSRAVANVAVEAARADRGMLALRFEASGDLRDLVVPAKARGRADGLWRTTCFEAFLAPAGAAGYCEFNFSPSGQWAAYRFDGYRQGMRALEEIYDPHIEIEAGPELLSVTVDLDLAAALPRREAWRLGLSAVIAVAGEDTSYWALAHPVAKPDFHHPDNFALELP